MGHTDQNDFSWVVKKKNLWVSRSAVKRGFSGTSFQRVVTDVALRVSRLPEKDTSQSC